MSKIDSVLQIFLDVRRFIQSDAAGGVEGLLATTAQAKAIKLWVAERSRFRLWAAASGPAIIPIRGEIMLRKAIASAVALSLVASPVLAQSSLPSPEPAVEQVDGDAELRRRGFILPLLGIAAILLLLWATDTWPFDEDDEPISP